MKFWCTLFLLLVCFSLHAEQTDTLTFNFKKINNLDLIRLLAQYSGKNIILSDKIPSQSLSLYLQKVSWQEALATILSSQGLAQRQVGDTLIIAPINEITQQLQQNFQLQQQQLQQTSLLSQVLTLKYAKAQDLAAMLKDKNNHLLSERGNVGVDVRTNSLWLEDNPNQLARVKALIQQLDVAMPQVAIEARIVTLDSNYEKELGLRFGISGGHHLSGTLAGANQLAARVNPSDIAIKDRLNFNFTNEAASASSGSLGLAMVKLADGYMLDMELAALQAEGVGEIIAKPSLMTTNQQAALIQTGEDVPYQEKTSSGATNVAFKKAVLSLEVTPQITSDNHILLNLHISQDKPSSKLINGVPAIDTREITTQVLVKDRQILVLGGIYEENENHQVERIPFISDLPFIGKLFQHQYEQKQKRELLIFIKPTIVGRFDSVTKNENK